MIKMFPIVDAAERIATQQAPNTDSVAGTTDPRIILVVAPI